MERAGENDFAIQGIFADNVRIYRRNAGLTQEELADMCGLHRTYIGRIEQNRENPSLGSAAKIARALGIDITFLFIDMENVRQPAHEKKLLTDYDLGDCALCTWTENGLTFEPIPTDDPDQTLRILQILAEDNVENLSEAYLEVKEKLVAAQAESNEGWAEVESDNSWLSDQFE